MASGAARPEIRISKQQLDEDIAGLVDRVSPNRGRWRAVIGVANGGIYPAGKVADGLGLAYDEIEMRGYRGREKSSVEIIRGLDDPAGGNGLLIVDDVVDSGDTALAIRDMLPKADFLVVYAKAEGARKIEASGMPLLCAERYPQDLWIVFPWHQEGWPGEVPAAVARYRAGRNLAAGIPITRQ
jgi:xanthine phosphoribosyltransferase